MSKQKPTFESQIQALENIVTQMEQSDLPLEKAMNLYEQGVKLSRELNTTLSDAQQKIEMLARDQDGKLVEGEGEHA